MRSGTVWIYVGGARAQEPNEIGNFFLRPGAQMLEGVLIQKV